ncbi:MAG: DUF2333 family protein, partial [Pseudomonadales bacterium]|nr:DUF2333 family protein [Pseudomonadales bacterium]
MMKNNKVLAPVMAVTAVLVLVLILMSLYWSSEPEPFDVIEQAMMRAENKDQGQVVGYTTTSTLIKVASTLLEKRGGYIS